MKKNKSAQDLVKERWSKATKEERKKVGKMLLESRKKRYDQRNIRSDNIGN